MMPISLLVIAALLPSPSIVMPVAVPVVMPVVQPPAPGARLVVTPADPVVVAEDTLRLRAQVVDAAGQPIANAQIRFVAAGGVFEGRVEPDGLVHSGSTGTLPVTVVAQIVGQPAITQRVEVRMVPGPAATIALDQTPTRLVPGQRFVLVPTVKSAAGDVRRDRVNWTSSNPAAVAVNADGMIEARAGGRAVLTGRVDRASITVPVDVVTSRVASMSITPSSRDARTGDVIRFQVTAKDAAGRTIAGVTPTYSFSPGQGIIDRDGAFTGYEGGTYLVTATLGTQSAQAVVRLTPRDVRRPATVVGRLPRMKFTTEEVWLHPTREIAYLGTGSGGDRMYTIDITDKTRPVVTDSIVENTRRVNDIMTTPDGKAMVFTREGASDRKNGIVIATLDDPLHPKKCADFTDGLTGGVHSTFVYRQEKFGTHVYLTNDGTGAFHIIDLNDPCQPKTAAVWKTPRPDAGDRCTMDVQDGPRLSELLERRSRHPRCRERGEGDRRQSAARLAVQVRPQRSLPAGRGVGRSRIHPRHAHGVASQQLRLHRRRSVSRGAGEGREGCIGRTRVWTTAGARCLGHREAEERGVLRAGVRRRAQRLGGRSHTVHGRLQRRIPRVRHFR